MRLHRLSVTAFGPFVETAQVDFDALTDSGLFLLSGATGSGKSSVLDAVCFALYGAIPGDRNHAGRLRSDQAPAGLAPCVELDVTLSGRRFRVTRSPAWDRPKRRGAGLTREPAKVTVSERVRDAWVPLSSRLDEAGDLLSGLLGMNLDQFCQVALLPQGHFQAFLRADSAQRHHLLARLFRTGRFERVEGWLRDHRLTLRRESQAHLTTVSDLVSRLSEAAASEAPETVAELSAAAGDGSLWSWAGELTRATETDLAAAETDAAAMLATARDASQAWERARDEAHARSRVREAAAAHERLTAATHDRAADAALLEAGRRAEGLRPLSRLVDDRRRRLDDADDVAQAALAGANARGLDVAELPAELGRLSHELSALTVLLPAEHRLSELRARHESRADALQALQRDDELAAAEGVTLARLVARLDAEVRGAVEAERALPTVEAEAVRLRAVAEAHVDAERLQSELALATADHSSAVGRLLDVREHLLDVRERRIAGMAAELAGALAVGDDCPVCGSAEHPHPALPATGHPDATAERTAQRAVDDAQAFEHALALRVRDAGSALATAREAAAGVAADDLGAVVDAAERVLSETRAEAARHAALTAQLTEAQRRAGALADERDVRRITVAELTTTLEHLRTQAAELEDQVAGARGEHPALAQAVEELEVRQASAQGACEALAARAAALGALDEAELALTRAALEAGFDDLVSARR